MNIQQIEEVFSIADTSVRCQRVLDEVQPILRNLMERFKATYSTQAPELLNYQVHTYEVTLRTTMHDARNPKYAEKKTNSDIGKKAFIELLNKLDFNTQHSVLNISFDGIERVLKVMIPTDFYPMWEAVRTQANRKKFEEMIATLPVDSTIQSSDGHQLAKHELIPYIQQAIAQKRKPWLYFGRFISFNQLPTDEELITMCWQTWIDLIPLRRFLSEEAEKHVLSRTILEQIYEPKEKDSIQIFGRNYEIQWEVPYDVKSTQRRQRYAVYDKGQLLVDGMVENYLREPHEAIGIFVNGAGFLFNNIRNLQGEGKIDWKITKSFKHQKGEDVNKTFQSKAMEALNQHDFDLDGTAFYAGTWDNGVRSFTETPIVVKKRLILASILFADSTGHITLPREADPGGIWIPSEDADPQEEIVYEHNFDLSMIFANIKDSGLTYSDAIIRDFHLNLTSLEDKHFVILNGISGTGKTRLVLLYANAVYGRPLHDVNPYLNVIPVRPDWTDATALFGYYSVLEKRYIRTPFLNALLQAIHEGKPMFVVLDEMNLARVEYYLSDYLSAVESKQPIRLHSEDHINDVPQEVHIPNNLYVIGTINVDETTHSISDKVLDRAFVMTLSDVELDLFWEHIASKYKITLEAEWKWIKQLHAILQPYDLHFGYRTLNEMLRKLYANAMLAIEYRMDPVEAVDRVIAEKVLPKLRGDERIAPLLDRLITWVQESLSQRTESLRHLERMKGELDRYGATQFWR